MQDQVAAITDQLRVCAQALRGLAVSSSTDDAGVALILLSFDLERAAQAIEVVAAPVAPEAAHGP